MRWCHLSVVIINPTGGPRLQWTRIRVAHLHSVSCLLVYVELPLRSPSLPSRLVSLFVPAVLVIREEWKEGIMRQVWHGGCGAIRAWSPVHLEPTAITPHHLCFNYADISSTHTVLRKRQQWSSERTDRCFCWPWRAALFWRWVCKSPYFIGSQFNCR